MVKILSYIILGIFLITHAYWQISLYIETKKIKTQSFNSIKEQIDNLRKESNLSEIFFQRIKLSRTISKFALAIYLILFIYMIISNAP